MHEHDLRAVPARRQPECPSARDRRPCNVRHTRLATGGHQACGGHCECRLPPKRSALKETVYVRPGSFGPNPTLAPFLPRDPLADPALAQAGRAVRVLIRMPWGLGDAVQLTCVLQHLAKHRPNWSIDVATGIGKHTAFAGLCRLSLALDRDPIDTARYDQVYELGWYECYELYENSPCTKTCQCLRHVFGIAPEPELLKYRIAVSRSARRLAADYLRTITGIYERPRRYPVVAVHYLGNTSPEKKDLSNEVVQSLCQELIARGYVPLVLDWDWRSPLPDQQTIFCPHVGPDDLWHGTGTGDAERLTALIAQCALMIGIDSGPLHVAGATDTPTIGVWTGHSPVQFYDLCDNVTHLVPSHWREIPPCQNAAPRKFFESHYVYRTYGDLERTLIETAVEALERSAVAGYVAPRRRAPKPHPVLSKGPVMHIPQRDQSQENPNGYGYSYYRRHKATGLDLLSYGAWQERYGWWLVEALGLDGRRVLDVGCACGSMLRGLLHAGADMEGVDCSEALVTLGRQQWPELQDRLYVVDAVNLHFMPDGRYDWLHSCVVLEHWKPELVPFILAELQRVLKPGGSFFCAYESDSGAMAGGRDPAEEQTHICLKPPAWWEDQLRKTGWQITSSDWSARLHAHPHCFFREYEWAWFVARKPN